MIGLTLLDDFGRQLGLFLAERSDDDNEISDRPEDCVCPMCRQWAAEIEAAGRKHLGLSGRIPDDSDLKRVEAFP